MSVVEPAMLAVAHSGLLAANPWVARRSITVTEYHRMGEVGILGEKDRVELIEGQLIEMAPIGTEHFGTANALNVLLVRAVGDRAVVHSQHPIRLDNFSEPQPDFALLRPRSDYYRKHFPGPEDVLLLIEVAHSSVNYDRQVKLPLYARNGIGEYWIVRLDTAVVEVYRSPGPGGYAFMQQFGPGETLEVERLPGITIAVADVLG